MHWLATFLFVLAGVFSVKAAPQCHVVTNCMGICRALAHFEGKPIPFDLTAKSLTGPSKYSFSLHVEDATGKATLNSGTLACPTNLQSGNIIHAIGTVCRWADGRPVTECTKLDIVAPGTPPNTHTVTVADVLQGGADCVTIKVTGRIKDVFYDDIDPRFIFFTLADPTGILYAILPSGGAEDEIFRFLNATVSVVGICLQNTLKNRPYLNRFLSLQSIDQVTVLNSPPEDPFSDPMLHPLPDTYSINQMLQDRVSSHGQIVARWQDRFFLLKDERGRFLTIETLDKTLPSLKDTVDVIGVPSANLYQLHLLRAIWRKSSPAAPGQESSPSLPIDISVRELLVDENGKRKIQVGLHGQTIRITGEIRSVPSSSDLGERLFVQCGDFVAPVEIGNVRDSLRQLSPGCRVSVSGTCIMDISNISIATPFPRIKGFFLVPRTEADIRIIRRPSWWTAGRLLALIGILLLILAGSLIWNVVLHRLAEKKGKELAAESMAHAESEIKIYERTRLAVELHDSIAQNLTGAALEIRAANRSHEDCDGLVPEHLDIALKTVDSCRNELRNCIWDLRNQSLEETDIDEAIRLTLQPVIGTTRLTVRFNVPRSIFSDPTIHTILCIIRELAVNGIRHGRASALKIAGAIENGHLLFSVKDNGCGYDTTRTPGMRSGHFGLQGIRERIRPYNGQFHVTSVPGHGTKASIDIKLPSSMQS